MLSIADKVNNGSLQGMKTITIGARISEQLDRDLRTLAVATGRSKSWLVAEALKSYVEAEKEFIEAVEEGIKANNRHVKYLDFDNHGYGVLDVTSRRTQMDYYVIGDRADRRSGAHWATSWATDAGTQRVHPVAGPVA